MYYFDEQAVKMMNLTDNEVFANDGYSGIYILEADEGIKNVFTGFVRGCNYCFETFVQVLNESLGQEFIYSVDNRDWNDGVTYDHEAKTISVDYHIDDLTPYCYCSGEIDENK